jgi:phosphate transport system substrate-binding protein
MVAAALLHSVTSAGAAGRITIVGSSTVYPFSSLVAEHFARSGSFAVPAVRSTSTAEGFKLLCAGIGAETPDISNASRPISAAERADCLRNGVSQIAEIRIGYDSLILANTLKSPPLNLTLDQLWRAAAEFVPIDGHLVPNPYRRWHDIDSSLPARPISLIGPGVGHGTRDSFIELVMEPRCKSAWHAEVAISPASCATIRRDGAWTDVQETELILGKLASNPDGLGILTYSYLEQFPNRIHAATIDGVLPSQANIPSGAYPLSRPLFIYVKEAHLKTTLGLADYATEFLSLCAAGAHGYLVDEGLVPLPSAELLRQRAAVARLQR